MGGLAGADTKCSTRATSAGLTGTWRAWLSTSTVNASSRLTGARGFVRADGQPFADQVSDIVAGRILNPLTIDETGNDRGRQDVWTGTDNNGTLETPIETCGDWGSTGASGWEGMSSGGPGIWSNEGASSSCNSFAFIYCFDVSHANALTITPVSGRTAFVSSGSFDTTTGISGADTLCQNEALGASLPNASQYKALLSTSTASAASRFDLSAGSQPYVRPDGIKIADAPAIASGIALKSGIWQHANGSYVSALGAGVWTGSLLPNTAGSLTSTCKDWSAATSATGETGASNQTDPAWWASGSNVPCGTPLSIYCLQP
jgi:hypothetical protein